VGPRLSVIISRCKVRQDFRTSRPLTIRANTDLYWFTGSCSLNIGFLTHMLVLQETIKTKHPQLLYESKLSMILQRGSEWASHVVQISYGWSWLSVFIILYVMIPFECKQHHNWVFLLILEMRQKSGHKCFCLCLPLILSWKRTV
jgi:hypothetical protein